jgi:hypothetical protein
VPFKKKTGKVVDKKKTLNLEASQISFQPGLNHGSPSYCEATQSWAGSTANNQESQLKINNE